MTDRPPTTLGGGRYVLIDPLGQGGAAQVYRALDTVLDVQRAVKIVKASSVQRGSTSRRQRTEADLLAQIDHPHILRVYDRGQHEGREWIIMDLMREGSLAHRVRTRGIMQLDDAIVAGLEICCALAAAHAVGIVHRDVKPHNILLDKHGRCVLADFGIALVAQADRHTRTGAHMGSFSYMAPEQRVDAKHLGPSADIYSLGATLYWLITGRASVDLFMDDADSQRMQAVPTQVRDVIVRCTRREPERRPQTAKELARLLVQATPGVLQLRPDLHPDLLPAPHPLLLTRSRSAQAAPNIVYWVGALVVFIATLVVATAWGLQAVLAPAPRIVEVTPQIVDAAPTIVEVTPEIVEVSPETTPPASADLAPHAQASVERRTPPTQSSSPPVVTDPWRGAWTGTFSDRAARLVLRGPAEHVEGKLTVRFMDSTIDNALLGSWNRDTGTLILVDSGDDVDAGRYEARVLDGDLVGTFFARHRDAERTFRFQRETP